MSDEIIITQNVIDDANRVTERIDAAGIAFKELLVKNAAEIERLKSELAALRKVVARVEAIRQYDAVEGYSEDGKKIIGMSYGGSDMWGFTHDPKYDSWELLESAEKWFHESIDKALEPYRQQFPR